MIWSLSVDEKVSYLIEIMTLEEKIGQMVQPTEVCYTQRCK